MPAPVAACAFTPVRLTQLDNVVIQLRLKTKHAPGSASRFTLHSITGLRMPDGRFQVERIAGFCHLRNCLKNYWLEQVGALQDPETSQEITDLTRWLASRPTPACHEAALTTLMPGAASGASAGG